MREFAVAIILCVILGTALQVFSFWLAVGIAREMLSAINENPGKM